MKNPEDFTAPSDRVRLALVGCGGIATQHVLGYQDLYQRGCREFEVTACCSGTEALAREKALKIAAFQGNEPRVFTDVRALIDEELADAADVCASHWQHHNIATELLDAGLHVQMEKPIGITIRASRRILAAAGRNQRILATAENVRRTIGARSCTWAIREAGLLGEMISGEAMALRPLKLTDWLANPRTRWRLSRFSSGGGMILDNGAHFADMMLTLFGEVDEIYCSMRTIDEGEIPGLPGIGGVKIDAENYFHAVIRFKKGIEISWTAFNRFAGVESHHGKYFGRDGAIASIGLAWHPFEGGGTITRSNDTSIGAEKLQAEYLLNLPEAQRIRLFPYGSTDGFACSTWDFVNAVRTGAPVEIDGEAGLRSKALCESCYESAVSGKPVKYADVLSGRVDRYQRPIDRFWGLLDGEARSADCRREILASLS